MNRNFCVNPWEVKRQGIRIPATAAGASPP